MSDKVAVLQDGHLEQFDAPNKLYDMPRTPFVSQFLGEANLLEVSTDGTVPSFGLQLSSGPGKALLRPEDIGVSELGDRGHGKCSVRVEQIFFQGPQLRLVARPVDDSSMDSLSFYISKDNADERVREGSVLTLTSKKKDIYLLADSR